MSSTEDLTPSSETPTEQPAAERIPSFSFPFRPGQFNATRDNQPWYQKNNGCNHDCRPGPAPRGSRRSMGKR